MKITCRVAAIVGLAPLIAGLSLTDASAKESHSSTYACTTTYVDPKTGSTRTLNGTMVFGPVMYETKGGKLVVDGATFTFDGYAPIQPFRMPSLRQGWKDADDEEEQDLPFLVLDGQRVAPVIYKIEDGDRAKIFIRFTNKMAPALTKRKDWMGECLQAEE